MTGSLFYECASSASCLRAHYSLVNLNVRSADMLHYVAAIAHLLPSQHSFGVYGGPWFQSTSYLTSAPYNP
eukprot:6185452-Pleurochrysis_carterae.AAC.1